VNPKTGRKEYVFANLELVYPSGDAESGYEFCFEELRAMKRGLIDPTGRVVKTKKREVSKKLASERPVTPPEQNVSPQNTKMHSERKFDIFQDTEASEVPMRMPVFDDTLPSGAPAKLSIFQDNETSLAPAKMAVFQDTETSKVPTKIPIFDDSEVPRSKSTAEAKTARKARREEKANRTRKLEIVEVKAEPQTSMLTP
jgi:checkpoint serine/threonine-protein kinase